MSEAVHTDYYCFRLPFLRLLRMLRLDYLSLLKMMNNLKNSMKKIRVICILNEKKLDRLEKKIHEIGNSRTRN